MTVKLIVSIDILLISTVSLSSGSIDKYRFRTVTS